MTQSRLSKCDIAQMQRAGLLPKPLSRRLFAQGLAFGASLFLVPGAYADELAKTPRLTEGPFYPDKLPLDTDNDLIVLNDSITPALGEITHLTGRVLSASGEPVRNAFVEIWQCDNNGAYLHAGTSNREKRDVNFQGYGRFLTDSEGQYYFRTIKPVAYPGRCPHIHYGVSRHGKRVLTTQLLIKGDPQNDRDGVIRELKDPKERELIMTDFTPIKDSKIGELAAKFDLVIGLTPDEKEERKVHGVGKPDIRRRS